MDPLMHGDIRITLSDADAIRGMQRTHLAVKKGLKKIDGEKAVVKVEGDIKGLQRSLKQAKAAVEKYDDEIAKMEKRRETLSGSQKGAVTKKLKALKEERDLVKQHIPIYEERIGLLKEELHHLRRFNKDADHATKIAEERLKLEQAIEKAIEREERAMRDLGKMQDRAHREMMADLDERERAHKRAHDKVMRFTEQEEAARVKVAAEAEKAEHSLGVEQTRAHNAMMADLAERDRARQRAHEKMMRFTEQEKDAEAARVMTIAKLQRQYDKVNERAQRASQQGRLGRAVSPTAAARFDIDQREAIGEMMMLRRKLELLGAKPIDINVNLKQSKILEQIANLGQIGMRLGPFTGTVSQFTKAALILGPILTGLAGSVTALAGAIGVGLTGALGIAGMGLVGFGGALGLAFAGIKPHLDDLSGIIKRSKDYNNKVEQYGKTSDEAGKSLEKLKHIMGDVDEETLNSFLSIDKLGSRWGKLTQEIRPDFFNLIGEGITDLNKMLPMLARFATKISGTQFDGLREWMDALSSIEGQGVLSTIFGNVDRALEPAMSGIGKLGAAFGRVTASFSRHFAPLMRDFEGWADSLNDAASNTNKLDAGVDNLVDSFRDTLDLTMAIGRVIKELAQASAGPGGDFMNDMADGLNRIAESIHNNPEPVAEFFEDSFETMRNLYGVLKPLAALFLEFSTILRPLTNLALQLAGAVASLVQAFAGFGPMRWVLTGLLSAWFLKRANIAVIGLMTGAINGLAAALGRAGLAGKSAAIGGIASRLSTMPVMAGRGAKGAAPRGPVGGILPGARVAPAPGAAAGAASLGRMTGFAAGFGRVLNGLSMGILGVSAPVAALGAAAVGAVIGIKKLSDTASRRANEEEAARKLLGKDVLPDRQFVDPGTPGRRTAGLPGGPTFRGRGASSAESWEKMRDAAIAAYRATLLVNQAIDRSGQLQRGLVDLASQRLNAQYSVTLAEREYASAVKEFGKNSLEAKMALQQLRDARRQEREATEQWRTSQKKAGDEVRNAVKLAQEALAKGWGTRAQGALEERLERAKDSLAAFRVNAERAGKGLEAFTGMGSEKIGHLVRTLGEIPGVKKLMLRIEDQDMAVKLADIIQKLDGIGRRRAVAKVLADTKNPEKALFALEALFARYERRNPKANLKAERREAERELERVNAKLDTYGSRKPTALLKARDEARAEIDRLNKQLDDLDKREVDAKVRVNFDIAMNNSPGGDRAQGDGWGAPNIKQQLGKMAVANKGRLQNSLLGGGALGNMTAMGSGLNAFNGLAQRFGLTVGSGFRKGSITSSGNLSYHAMGRARDFPGPPGAMMAFARFMAASFGSRLKELIYTPLGFSIKNGRKTAPYAQAQHYDHVHVAMAQGGRVTSPTVLFGEEPGHPEYFISTNPRDKKRSQRLVAAAAAEVGMLEHSPAFYAQGRGQGDGPGFAVGGKMATKAQQRLIWTALREAKRLGASEKATMALVMAIMHESRAKNLRGGHSTSSGPLQVLAETARGMGIDPRNTRQVANAFLTKGFWGKGSAMKLSENRKLSAAEVAHLVQGNATGTSVYRSELGNAGSAVRAFNRNPKAAAPRLHGRTGSLANRITRAEGRYTRAQATPRYADDPAARARLGTLLTTQSANAQARLAEIDNKLKGKLTKKKRNELLGEKGDLVSTIEANKTRLQSLRQEAADSVKREAEAYMDFYTAQAAGTVTLTDDLAVAKNNLEYWKKRLAEASAAGDVAGAAAAQNNINSLTQQIGTLSDDIKRQPLDAAKALAGLTEDTADDRAANIALRDYWQGKLDEAKAAGDNPAIVEAANNLKSINDELKQFTGQTGHILSVVRGELAREYGSNVMSFNWAKPSVPVGSVINNMLTRANIPHTPSGPFIPAGGSGATIVNNFAAPPPDSYTFSRQLAWDVRTAF